MQTTKNKPKTESTNTTQDTTLPHLDNQDHAQDCGNQRLDTERLIELLMKSARCLRSPDNDQDPAEQPQAKDLQDMIMDANILVCVSMAAAQGVIALYQEQVGELDAISEMAVAGLQHSISMVEEAILKMEVYA